MLVQVKSGCIYWKVKSGYFSYVRLGQVRYDLVMFVQFKSG
jgi:hypothetical protein